MNSSVIKSINELLDHPQWQESLTGAILVGHGDDVLAERAYGFANRSWSVPNTVESVFRIASITKFFTAAIVLRLVEEQKVKLNEFISAYLPYYRSDNGGKITVHHLLSHTSGLTHFPKAHTDFMATYARHKHDMRDMARDFCSDDLMAEPGEQFNYSNDNYILLGLIIEETSGLSYAEALGKYIFEPAGLRFTGLSDHETVVPKLAQGYVWRDDHYENADYVEMSVPWAAGGVYSTVGDLFKFYRSLENGVIISKASFDLICSPHSFNGSQHVGYNCIFSNQATEGVLTVPGGLHGYDTALWFIRRNQSFLVLLLNTNNQRPDGLPSAILKCLGEL